MTIGMNGPKSRRLTDERMDHIMKNHPETKNCVSWILETIENPDSIISGDFGELIAYRKIFGKCSLIS